MAKKRASRPANRPAASAPASSPGRATAASMHRNQTAARSSSAGRRAPRPPTSPQRAALERFSAPILLRMQLLPGFVVPSLMGLALFLGLVLPWAWAGLLLVAIAVFMTWLAVVSWPNLTIGSRIARTVINLAIAGIGIGRLLGTF